MKKRLAILLCVLLLMVGLVGCVEKGAVKQSTKQYTMDLDVGISKTSAITSDDWDISCKAITKIEYKYVGNSTDNISLQFNAATFTDRTPIDNTMYHAGYPVGARYGKAVINSVTVGGKTRPSALEGNELKIKLEKKVKNGARLEIVVDYYIELPRCNMRYGYNKYTVNFAQFYPQAMRVEEYSEMGDSFYSTSDNYTVNIKYPAQYKCVASGVATTTASTSTTTAVTYEAKDIRDFAFFIGLVGNVATKTENGVTIDYMYWNDSKHQEHMDIALSAINVFSEKFGNYGKSHFSMVATPFAHGGMEYGDIISINSAISDDRTFNNVIVHEVAHQWWYGAVGSDPTNHAWQDEGLTEFSVYYYYQAMSNGHEPNNSYIWQAEDSIKAYRNKLNSLGVPIDDTMNRPLDDFVTTDEYVYAVYDKGLMMFKTVYDCMGEKQFISAIQDYFKTYKGDLATPQNLFDTLDKYHQGISEVMKAWLNGNVINCWLAVK